MYRTGIGLLLVCLLCVSTCVLGQNMVNIAPGKSYDQSSTSGSTTLASNAADGNTNRLPRFLSNLEHNPYWEVDLGRTYPVHNITLWSFGTLLSGSAMFPVNITVDDQHCVTVSSNPTGFRNNSLACSSLLYGRRVRVTGTGTGSRYLVIPEIEILVPTGDRRCDEGRWGPGCQHHCTNNCGEVTSPNFCYESTLNCYDECVAGRWGDRCQNRCGQHCATGDCGLKTGNCSACLPGWYGDQCTTRCQSQSCLLNTCHQTTGRCLACHTGFDGHTCTACVTGRWGEQCQHSCSVTCVNTACHRDTGVCIACVTGRWGEQCQYSCSVTCVNTACHRDTGVCTGCVDGRHGATCSTTCSPAGCQTCHQHSGQCTTCKPFYNLDPTSQCKECVDGFYRKTAHAVHCTECLGRCYNNTACDKTTGDCHRCPPGWEGPRCFKGVSKEEAEKLIGPVVGAITGVGLLLIVSLLVFLCWKQRSQKTGHETDKTTTSASDPASAHNPSPLSAEPQVDREHEIRDPGNPYEHLRVYTNMMFDRELPVAPESRADDVTATSEHAGISPDHIYVNTTTTTSKNVNPRSKKSK